MFYASHKISRWLSGKQSSYQFRRLKTLGFDSWVRKIPWIRKGQPTPVFLPRESHGQKSQVGYSPWGCKESDTTERLTHTLYIFYYLSYCLSCLLSLPSWNIYSTKNYSFSLEEYQAYYRRAKYICLMSEEIVPGPVICKNLTHHWVYSIMKAHIIESYHCYLENLLQIDK